MVLHNNYSIFHCVRLALSLYPTPLIYNSLVDRCQRQFYRSPPFVVNVVNPPEMNAQAAAEEEEEEEKEILIRESESIECSLT